MGREDLAHTPSIKKADTSSEASPEEAKFLDVLKNPEVKEISSLSTICTSDVNHELKNTEGEFNLKLKQKTQRYERVKQAQNSKQKGKKGRNKEDQNKDSDIDENSNSSDDE